MTAHRSKKDGNKPPRIPSPQNNQKTTFDPNTIVGIVVDKKGELCVKPCDKKKFGVHYKTVDLAGAKKGDLVVARFADPKRHTVGVTRILGPHTDVSLLSLISLYERGLKEDFSVAAHKETETMTVPELGDREDLRQIPLVTVDGKDTRDFDDAIFAEKLPDGGHHLIVAIADVSWYVRPGTEIDREAQERGNSTYFPDRAVPMLPKELSNGLCSLNPHEDRACMAFHLYIDKDGNLTKYNVVRGLMNSAARLTYDQLQEARDGNPDATTRPLMDTVVNPLYEAYAVLRKERENRGALNSEQTEFKISQDKSGDLKLSRLERCDSWKVIEEFMILANVAAASALEDKNAPCMYRVHQAPASGDRLDSLRDFLSTFGITLPEGAPEKASFFNDALAKAAETEGGDMIGKAIMRVQSKAAYSQKNAGHFGLALRRYAHFTSPIRRYSDLIVHRSLVDAFNLGPGGLSQQQTEKFDDIALHINDTEMMSDKAQRTAYDRFAALAMSRRIGATMGGVIRAVTPSGIFVRLDNSGSDAFLPVGRLPEDDYVRDADRQTLKGRKHGHTYRVGARMTVRITKADSLTADVVVAPANDNRAGKAQGFTTPKHHKRNKPARPK